MSQSAVTGIMGISRSYLTKIELSGIMPTLKNVYRIEDALGVPHGTVMLIASNLYRRGQ
ncbi:MAG: helix-turn-helix transcriptional regulator [Acidobacteria bacterium]|nr:helix-turn-helix transcriptional regulator [Acidobacteriota bacterium]